MNINLEILDSDGEDSELIIKNDNKKMEVEDSDKEIEIMIDKSD